MKILSLSIILSLLILQSLCYTVTYDCINKCSGCKASCLIYDGGPFDSNKLCISNCTSLYKTQIQIGCSFGCSGSCDYRYTSQSYTISGCATPQDNLWAAIELQLNLAYKAFIKSGTNYDWIGGVCTWTIIGIVIGILGGIAIVIGVIIFIRRRNAGKGRSLLNSSTDQ